MSQERKANLQCTGCKRTNYQTVKNPKLKDRLELKKFCSFCKNEKTGKAGTHVVHKETK